VPNEGQLGRTKPTGPSSSFGFPGATPYVHPSQGVYTDVAYLLLEEKGFTEKFNILLGNMPVRCYGKEIHK
jgi:hypothetical protein